MIDQDLATAHHEAGHAIALRHFGIQVSKVSVNNDGTGSTELEGSLPAREEDTVLVGLIGIQSELRFLGADMTFSDFVSTYESGKGDRDTIESETRTIWLAHRGIWHQVQYDNTETFIEKKKSEIEKLASAILRKKGYPKALDQKEIESVMKI